MYYAVIDCCSSNELYRKQSKAEDILTTARNSWTEKSVSPRIM